MVFISEQYLAGISVETALSLYIKFGENWHLYYMESSIHEHKHTQIHSNTTPLL